MCYWVVRRLNKKQKQTIYLQIALFVCVNKINQVFVMCTVKHLLGIKHKKEKLEIYKTYRMQKRHNFKKDM